VAIGVNHKKASLATLDALNLRDLGSFYKDLRIIQGVTECVVLQTCNRVEIFLDTVDDQAVQSVFRAWSLSTKLDLDEIQTIADVKTGDEVIEHLVRLAIGLESMIVGEPQILGQMKESMITAQTYHATGPVLSEVFERATSAGAKIRSETGIGRGVTTIGSAALKLAEQTLGKLDNPRVLLIGTGQVGALVMKALKARGLSNVAVAGRNHEKTEAFCRSFGGTPIASHRIADVIRNSDLILVATRSARYVLDRESVGQRAGGPSQRLMILDLSNPRNVSPDVAKLSGVALRTIDDLKGIAEEGLAMRREIAKSAEPLVRSAVERISVGLRRENAEPMIADAFHRAEEIRIEELGKALSKLNLTTEQKQVLEYMSQKIVEKVLNGPVMNLRRTAEKGGTNARTVAEEILAGD
jgi:glutamyl-tRNA reductase